MAARRERNGATRHSGAFRAYRFGTSFILPREAGKGTARRAVEGALAAPLAQALHAPSTAQTRGPPPPLHFTTRWRISERVPATRSAPEACEKCTVGSLPTGPARSGRPDDKLHSVTHHAERWVSLRSTHPTKRNDEKKKGSGTPTDVFSQPPRPCLFPLSRLRGRVREGARSPIGVPPRLLLQRANAAAQLQIRTSWDLVGAHDPKLRTTGFEKPCAFSAGVTRSFLSQSSEGYLADRS